MWTNSQESSGGDTASGLPVMGSEFMAVFQKYEVPGRMVATRTRSVGQGSRGGTLSQRDWVSHMWVPGAAARRMSVLASMCASLSTLTPIVPSLDCRGILRGIGNTRIAITTRRLKAKRYLLPQLPCLPGRHHSATVHFASG